MDGLVTRLVARKEISGKLAEIVRLLSPPGLPTGELIIVGLGDRQTFGQMQAVRGGSECKTAGGPASHARRLLFRQQLG